MSVTTVGPAAIDEALLWAVDRTNAHVGAVYLAVPGEPVLELAAVVGSPRREAEKWFRLAWAEPVPVAWAARERKLLWLPSHQELVRRFPRTALAFPFDVAMCAAPLIADDTLWGVLLLLWPGSRSAAPPPDEFRKISGICDLLASTLARAEKSGSPLRTDGGVRYLDPPPRQQAAGSRSDAQALVERFDEGLCSLDVEGRIVSHNRAAQTLLGTSAQLLGTRLWETVPWLDDPAHETVFMSAIFTRQATAFFAVRPSHRGLSFEFHPDATGVSVRISPATAPDTVPISPSALSAADPMSTGALHYLMRLSSAFTAALGMDDLTEVVTQEVMPIIRTQAMALVTSDQGRLHVLSSHGFPPGVTAFFDGMLLTSNVASVQAIRRGLPAFYSDNKALQRLYPQVPLYHEMAAFSYLPLIARGQVIGCCVLGYSAPHLFTAQERAALTSLSGIIAQAVERARLYDATYRVASGLQEALLPQELPRVEHLDVAARYLPATRGMEVGGDFYDLIRVDDTRVVAVIGDVQGHSVSAAALMGQIRATVHSHAMSGAPPDEVLRLTNNLLTDLDSRLFASCLCAEIDLAGRRARFASAGHLPPVVRQPDGPAGLIDVPVGILLGVAAGTDYRCTEVDLLPGSLIALYTDGLIEKPRVDLDEALGRLTGRLSNAWPDRLDRLADDLMTWGRRSTEGHDDIALLLVRLLDPVFED